MTYNQHICFVPLACSLTCISMCSVLVPSSASWQIPLVSPGLQLHALSRLPHYMVIHHNAPKKVWWYNEQGEVTVCLPLGKPYHVSWCISIWHTSKSVGKGVHDKENKVWPCESQTGKLLWLVKYNSTICRMSTVTIESSIHGHHVYRSIWAPVIEVLVYKWKRHNITYCKSTSFCQHARTIHDMHNFSISSCNCRWVYFAA